MHHTLILRTLGILLLLFSFSLWPPALLSVWFDDHEFGHFFITIAASLVVGLALWLPLRSTRLTLRSRDGFVIVAMFWLLLSLFATIPMVLGFRIDVSDAFFEAASAFTTTGATVLSGLDDMPRSLLFYRQELQWLGGIGVIVTAVALLPMLGIGGMQIYRAETPGPMKDEKITPRIQHTAQAVWKIYGLMTLACTLAYWVAGMPLFDAVAHSLTTVSTGGFSTHDASFAYFDSQLIELVAVAFMLIGAINFGVHFMALARLRMDYYWKNVEVRAFVVSILVLIVLVTLTLRGTGYSDDFGRALRLATFEVVSVITSTGYGIEDFSLWPLALPVLLIFASFMGGCAGSTAGGMKVIRFVLMWRQGLLAIQRLTHPRLVRALKFGGRLVPNSVVEGIWAFFALYVVTFGVMMLLLMMTGLDQVTAFGAVATCINNLGPGLGAVSQSFAGVSDLAKWLLGLTMILGRLEVFTVLVLISPGFWRS
jgi:trk system potassium uptake protein TrkH